MSSAKRKQQREAYSRNSLSSAATPAEPGELPIGLDIANIDQQPISGIQQKELYTFAVVNSAPFVFARQERTLPAPIATAVAAIYEIGYALNNREGCVNQTYGRGLF